MLPRPRIRGCHGHVWRGQTYGPQLIAEIGDVSRFTHREAITALQVSIPVWSSQGAQLKEQQSFQMWNRQVCKTLFQVMTTLLQNAPENEPVYQFLNRKRSEGKPYYVYMTAGANKFLRIYYGKVKAHLRSLEQNE